MLCHTAPLHSRYASFWRTHQRENKGRRGPRELAAWEKVCKRGNGRSAGLKGDYGGCYDSEGGKRRR